MGVSIFFNLFSKPNYTGVKKIFICCDLCLYFWVCLWEWIVNLFIFVLFCLIRVLFANSLTLPLCMSISLSKVTHYNTNLGMTSFFIYNSSKYYKSTKSVDSGSYGLPFGRLPVLDGLKLVNTEYIIAIQEQTVRFIILMKVCTPLIFQFESIVIYLYICLFYYAILYGSYISWLSKGMNIWQPLSTRMPPLSSYIIAYTNTYIE